MTDREIQQAALAEVAGANAEFVAHFDPHRVEVMLDVIEAARPVIRRWAGYSTTSPNHPLVAAFAAYDALDKATDG
jgi:hypothetical protein